MRKLWASLKTRVAYNDALRHLNLGHTKTAGDIAQTVLAIEPNHQGALWISASLPMGADDLVGAATQFSRLSNLDSDNPEVVIRRRCWTPIGELTH